MVGPSGVTKSILSYKDKLTPVTPESPRVYRVAPRSWRLRPTTVFITTRITYKGFDLNKRKAMGLPFTEVGKRTAGLGLGSAGATCARVKFN